MYSCSPGPLGKSSSLLSLDTQYAFFVGPTGPLGCVPLVPDFGSRNQMYAPAVVLDGVSLV